jgi:hypothetical protein
MALFRKRPHREVSFEDSWMVISGMHEEKPLIARFDTSGEQLKGRYSIQVGVAIPFNDPTPEGMPTPEETVQLDAIETTLLREAHEQSVLVGAITTGGMREFVLYTNSSAWLEAFHAAMKAAVPTHPVHVIAKNDPDWSVYKSFVT